MRVMKSQLRPGQDEEKWHWFSPRIHLYFTLFHTLWWRSVSGNYSRRDSSTGGCAFKLLSTARCLIRIQLCKVTLSMLAVKHGELCPGKISLQEKTVSPAAQPRTVLKSFGSVSTLKLHHNEFSLAEPGDLWQRYIFFPVFKQVSHTCNITKPDLSCFILSLIFWHSHMRVRGKGKEKRKSWNFKFSCFVDLKIVLFFFVRKNE